MKNSKYQVMPDEELRDWVRYHPSDVEAFHTLMDRLDISENYQSFTVDSLQDANASNTN